MPDREGPPGEHTDLADAGNNRYLKKYVAEHPDNKMAWYLLGREYMRKGEQGKARYCFEQAAEIYQAFENPDGDSFAFLGQNEAEDRAENGGFPRRSADKPGKRGPRLWLWRGVRCGVVTAWGLMLLLFVPSMRPLPSDSAQPPSAKEQSVAPAPTAPANSASPAAELVPPPAAEAVMLLTDGDGEEGWKQALQQAILPPHLAWRTIVAEAGRSTAPGWFDWSKPVQVLLSASQAEDQRQTTIQYYSKAVCSCMPDDSSSAARAVAAWKSMQEELLTLLSAIASYRSDHGDYPQSMDALRGDYPGNYIPGGTPLMEKLFAPLEDELRAAGPPASANAALPDGASTVVGNLSRPADAVAAARRLSDGRFNLSPGENAWEQPLEIRVDKRHHRLAVVSGSMIIRNYPVGLGGARTPDGEYRITEKVMNPNGKTDGDFGSRGMTLSDTLYAIHGTNKPDSIGKDESLGCIRMERADVEELYDMVPKGTKVTIADGGLPQEIIRGDKPFSLPHEAVETNPGKVYHWLD